MSRSAYRKGIARSIRGSIGRFVAIAIIAALGTGFYSGLRMCGPDMELAADEYYDATNMSDLRIVGSLGLDDEAIEELAEIEGVEATTGERELDVLSTIDGVQYAVRVHGLDVEAAAASDTSDGLHAISDDPTYINRPILVEGSWPTEPNECLLSADAVLETEVQIGDTVVLSEVSDGSELSESFDVTTYTVTGFVRMSYYINTASLGTTTLGTGLIDDFMLIPDESFADDLPYTGAFITVEGARELMAGSDEYESLVDEVEERISAASETISQARLERIRSAAQDELDEGRSTYEEERADALAQLADAEAELADARRQLAEAEAELADAQAQLDEAWAEIEAGEAELASSRQALEESQAEIDAGWSEHDDAAAELAFQREQAYAELDAAQALIDAWAAMADPDDPVAQAQIAAAQAELDMNRAETETQLAAAQAELDAAAAQLTEAQAQVDSGWAACREAEQALEDARALYNSGSYELDEGRSEYLEGSSEYQSGLAEYISQRDDAMAQLEEAEAELASAQEVFDSLEDPELYILDNRKNTGAETYGSDAVRIDQIAQVFPTIFYLVAALVSLTTMTRMVDEERVIIGTYKALGYSNRTIIAKYLTYALLASGIGSIIGILALTQLLPRFIMSAYAIVYTVPVHPTPIDPVLAVAAAAIGIGITLGATTWAAASSLREKPATLMLPRAPKAGHRIFLERIRPLWRKMSFSWKVTSRNIFRYKKRFFMAIIGIAGCTALLLTGFGLQDSINDIIDKQYENDDRIFSYNLTITLDSDISEESRQELFSILDNDGRLSEYELMHSENMVVSDEDGSQQRVHVEAPKDPDALSGYVSMRERLTGEELTLEPDTVIVSEKMADSLGLAVGDELVIYEEDTVGNAIGDGYAFTIGGIMENYVDRYVYMYPSLFEETTGLSCDFTTIMATTVDGQEDRLSLSDDLLAIDGVDTVSYIDDAITYYRTALRSVDSVVIVLILAAAALAFVVLYNLTNINIAERQREIATLKVLGFTETEYTLYIFREIIILSMIGSLIGLVLGIFLENFVVVTAEVDAVMFGRDIHPTSFLYSFLLTMLFTVIIALGMKYKLIRISMVESLKSVD